MLTKEQLEERLNYIGASEAAAVLGLSRWSTPLQVWAIKTRQIPYSEEETLQQWVGSELEEVVAKRFTKETGKKVWRLTETIYHKEYPFLACHIDRKVMGEDAILQCKTATAWKAKEWEGEDIPQEYIIQEYHELACTGYQKAYIACLIGNHKFVIKEIHYDEHIIGNLIQKEVYFWREFVEPKVMPMQISVKDTDTLYQLFPVAIEKEVEFDDSANILIENIQAMKEDRQSLEGRIGKSENELKAMLQEAEAGHTSLYRITWKNKVIPAHPVKESKFRTLRITEIKEA